MWEKGCAMWNLGFTTIGAPGNHPRNTTASASCDGGVDPERFALSQNQLSPLIPTARLRHAPSRHLVPVSPRKHPISMKPKRSSTSHRLTPHPVSTPNPNQFFIRTLAKACPVTVFDTTNLRPNKNHSLEGHTARMHQLRHNESGTAASQAENSTFSPDTRNTYMGY